jgi:hypothetical protein
MTRALAVAVAVALVVVASAAPARAQSAGRAAEARRHLDKGNRLYLEGRYDDAIVELQAGYALEQRPDFLYALGQAERKRGDCKAAIRYYQAFVDTGQSPQRTVAVLVQIDRCKQELAAGPATPSAPSAPPVAAEPSPSPSASPSPPQSPAPAPPAAAATSAAVIAPSPADTSAASATRSPIYKRWWLWTIVGVAAAGAAVGLGVGLTQRSFSSTLPDLVIGKSAVRF